MAVATKRKTRSATAARRDPAGIRIRMGLLTPATLDVKERSVEAVLGTEDPCLSMDLKTRKTFLEVYRMDGAVLSAQVPLIDSHVRDTVHRVLGSTRAIRTDGDQLVGRLFVADSEYETWNKIKGRHITDVSWGVQPLETTEIKAGQSKEIKGRTYTAPAGRSLFVHTKWRLREVSVTPIGSDERAKIRSLLEETNMKKSLRNWLEANMKLRAEATEEEAQTLWDSLAAADRTRAEEACREADDEEDEDEDEEDEEDEPDKPALHRVTRKSVVTTETRTAEETERIRQEALEEGRKAELARQARIRRLADKDVPAEIVERAISENWRIGRVRTVFLRTVREARSASAGGGGNVEGIEMTRELFGSAPAGHVRNHEVDCTIGSLAASLISRGYTGKQDLCNLVGGYQASPSMIDEATGKPESGRCYTVRGDVSQMLAGRTRQASDARRKAAERLLELGDRYRGMLPMDIVDECNRMEGRARTSYDREERVRAAMSGSALSAIFTQNVAV